MKPVVDKTIYSILAVFVIGMLVLGIIGDRAERADIAQVEQTEGEEVAAPVKTMFSDEDIAKRQEKLESLATENPHLFVFIGLINLAIIFLIFLGVLLNGYLFSRWRKKETVDIRVVNPESAKWGIGDVFRVVLIFLSGAYVFVFIQAVCVKFFPILNNENFRMVFSTVVMNIVGIGILFVFVVKKYHQNIETVGLTEKGFFRSTFYGVAGYIALLPVILVIMVATYFVTKWIKYQPPVQPIVQVFIEEKETSVLWISTIFAAIFGPIAEEVFFRGFVYNAVKKKFGIMVSVFSTAIIFSLLHAHIVGFLPIMVLGVLLAYLYEKTGSLVAPITVHIIHNMGMVVLVFIIRTLGV